ncbi:MAG: hypothetical protein Tsb0014_09250 [Pleurocapsa sp.]
MFNKNKNAFLFTDILQKGLGRAFDYIAQHKHNKEKIRQDLLSACLHNVAYDPQCESTRAEWLFELINLTNDIEFYRKNIFQALPIAQEFWDINQLYDLVSIWAKQGCLEAKKIIYQTFKQQEFNESWLGGEHIIAIEGIQGLLAVAEIVGARLIEDNELWEDDYLITQASAIFDKNLVIESIEKEAVNNSKVKAYLDSVKTYQENTLKQKEDRKKSKNNTIDINTIIEKIEQKKYRGYVLSRFGRDATKQEIDRVFEKLLSETRKEQLIRYLHVFRYRKLPKLDIRLFDLAKSDDEEIQLPAIAALAVNKDDSLHNLAINLIKQQPKSINNRVLKLLINNYQSDDFKIIESILNKSHDIDLRHEIGMDLIDIIDKQKTAELINCSLWVYENTPCSYCRQEILKILIESKQVSQNILEECLHDCSPAIRAISKSKIY